MLSKRHFSSLVVGMYEKIRKKELSHVHGKMSCKCMEKLIPMLYFKKMLNQYLCKIMKTNCTFTGLQKRPVKCSVDELKRINI